MTKLLVSVRDAAEAKIALDAGVDLIDIKEPRQGSLGKADDAVIGEISQLVGRRRPLSAALGELVDYAADRAAIVSLPSAIRFAKIGLAGCRDDSIWPRRLAAFWERLPTNLGRIAVVYADWQTARAPSPAEVLQHARSLHCNGVLVDTFDKLQLRLTALWTESQLRDFTSAAKQLELITVLAGRIAAEDVAQLLQHRPDYLAVRGAVCRHDRNGTLDAIKTRAFHQLIAANLEFARSSAADHLTPAGKTVVEASSATTV